MELKARKDMDPAFMWDLTHIFETDKLWENTLEEAENGLEALEGYQGTLGTSPDHLRKILDHVFEVEEKVNRTYIYAMLLKAADGGEDKALTMTARATALYTKFGTVTAYLTPELLSLGKEQTEQLLQEDVLKEYHHFLENIFRGRKHTLDSEREKMLAMLFDASRTAENVFDALTDVDMLFPKVKNEKGEEVQLTSGNFSVFRESSDRRVREEAFEAHFGEYKKYINSIAEMYAGSVKFDCFFSSVRNYESAAQAALFKDNAPLSVYHSLVEAVHDSLPAMKRYLALRAKVLNLPKLDLFDLYTPMVTKVEFPMPYEKAKELVKKALLPLGERYQELLDKAYNEGWIDVYENKGKQSGAFSCGVHGVHPYIKLNYTDTLDYAFTLAHELGHAMHSYFSSEKQTYANHSYTIMVAEVASTCNEVLLTRYLLKEEKDPARRAYILNHFLEGFRTTVFRQTLFAEFEYKAHEMYEKGQPLTPQSLSALYKELLELYYEGAEVPTIMQYEWSYIPHFYNAFYVYKYATGFSSAVSIADRILKTGDAGDYLNFLSLGGSDYPVEELKTAGVDLCDPATVKTALKVFADTVDELEKLLV